MSGRRRPVHSRTSIRGAIASFGSNVPTYKAVYGAVAVFPVFLLWVYFSWLVPLAAALVTANLTGARRR